MIDRGKLHRQAIGVREIDPIRTARAVWVQSPALQLLHHRISLEVLNSNAVVVQPRVRVLEERQEIFPEAEKTVRLRFVDDRQAKVLLIEVSGARDIRNANRDVVERDSLECRPVSGTSVCCAGQGRKTLYQLTPTDFAALVSCQQVRNDLFHGGWSSR